MDEEEEVVEAFRSFEKPGQEGEVDTETMRSWLRDYGDKMTDEEVRVPSCLVLTLPGNAMLNPGFLLTSSALDRSPLPWSIYRPFRPFLQLSRIRKELEGECEW